MQVPATTRMILSNFDNTGDYLKVANVLNNIVDTQRIFRIDSINTTEARFYSLTDPDHKIITKPTDEMMIYDRYRVKPLSDEHIQKLNNDKTVIYHLNVETEKFKDKFIIADETFIPNDDEPEDRNDIATKYLKYFTENKNQYNYVSLENVVPLTDKVIDLNDKSDADLLFPISRYEPDSVPSIKTNLWGIKQDPNFDCQYNLANNSISFDFNASDGQYRDDKIMDEFIDFYDNVPIRMSRLDEFIANADDYIVQAEVDEFPQIIQCMYRLYLKTDVDFLIQLTSI